MPLDVRNDADALWALYHVSLAGVTDIQLLENASRTGDKTYVRGLDKSVHFDLKLGFMELNRWIRTKKEALMSINVFASRPVDATTVHYCTNDVLYLPDLHALYLKRIQGDWLARAKQESERRVAEAHSPGYEPHSSGTTMRWATMVMMIMMISQIVVMRSALKIVVRLQIDGTGKFTRIYSKLVLRRYTYPQLQNYHANQRGSATTTEATYFSLNLTLNQSLY